MLHHCLCCDWSIDDLLPNLSYEQMTADVKNFQQYTGHARCPRCGSIAIPEHFESSEIETWLRLFSNCKNAQFCWEWETYRPECEQGIFYPGCLKYLYQSFYQMNLILQHAHGIDAAALDELIHKDSTKYNRK